MRGSCSSYITLNQISSIFLSFLTVHEVRINYALRTQYKPSSNLLYWLKI
jgi:hypothetical protein